jgi:hypothetical protein
LWNAVEQIVGRERRKRVSQLAWRGEGCFDSRRRVNSTVRQHLLKMANRILACTLLLVVGLDVYAQRSTNHASAFNPSGDYHPVNRPNGSEQFIQFVLQVRYRRGRRVAWGEVASVAQFYRFKSVSVTETHLRFSTERHHGIRYDFEGSFLRRGNFTTAPDIPGSLPLKGTLRKFVNGKKVMELITSFVYYVGC